MILAKNEIILNEWNYATSFGSLFASKRYKNSHTLTVTNKRVVSSVSNSRKVERREVSIDSIQNISLRHEMPAKLGPILWILFSLVLIAASVVCPIIFRYIFLIPIAVVVGLIAIGIIIDSIVNLIRSQFYVELFTNAYSENTVMSFSYDNLNWRTPKKKLKILVDNKIARDIIENLGSLIFECK